MSNHPNRILVIHWDDDELISLEQLLENQGFETTTTWDLQEGLNLLRTRHFNLVLVADHEPECDAGEVLRALQSRIPSVVLRNGGHSDPEYFFALGANKVLFPWEREKLIKFLRATLGEKTTMHMVPAIATN
jgi:CheY-like chemotaxis protein